MGSEQNPESVTDVPNLTPDVSFGTQATRSAERVAAPTIADLIEYLSQFNPDMVVYLDIEAAVEDGYAEDYVEQAYVSLSYALGKLEEQAELNDGEDHAG